MVGLVPWRQQMPLICPRIYLTGKRAASFPCSFKGGPCEFINLLSRAYLAEYIIHGGTSFNLHIWDQKVKGQMFFLWTRPASSDEVALLRGKQPASWISWCV